jgi:hypothetical protein
MKSHLDEALGYERQHPTASFGGWSGSLVMCKIAVPSTASGGLQNREMSNEKQVTGSRNNWISLIN